MTTASIYYNFSSNLKFDISDDFHLIFIDLCLRDKDGMLMKRVILFVLVIVITVSLFSACKSKVEIPASENFESVPIVSSDVSTLPNATLTSSESTENTYVFDDVVTPIDCDLSFDYVMERLDEFAITDNIEHSTNYESDYQAYMQQQMVPDECGIVWYEPNDIDYHTTREYKFDDLVITEYTDSQWAEIAYRINTNNSNEYRTYVETTDSSFNEGYCFERIEYSNSRIGFSVHYYFGNCVISYSFTWGTDYRPEYCKAINICEILGLPISENISSSILETDESDLNLYDKIEIIREELHVLISSEEYLELDDENRAQLMFETLETIADNRYADFTYSLFDIRRINSLYDESEGMYHIGILLEDSYAGQWFYFRVTDTPNNLFFGDEQYCYNYYD